MTDDHTPDQPAPEQGGSLPVEAAEEEDVDSLLENASLLAAELSEEVGESAGAGDSQPDAGEFGSTGDVDRTLDEMDHLLDTAGEALGSAADSKGKAEEDSESGVDQDLPAGAASLNDQPVDGSEASGIRLGAVADESETPVSTAGPAQDGFEAPDEQQAESSALPADTEPDFPEPAASGEPPAEDTDPSDEKEKHPTSDQDSPFGDLDMDSLGGDIPSLDDEGDGADTPPTGSANEAPDEKPATDQNETPEAEASDEQSKLSAIALAGCSRGAGILELADRPFGWVSQPIRRLVGWVALGTFATAVIVFLISLF